MVFSQPCFASLNTVSSVRSSVVRKLNLNKEHCNRYDQIKEYIFGNLKLLKNSINQLHNVLVSFLEHYPQGKKPCMFEINKPCLCV